MDGDTPVESGIPDFLQLHSGNLTASSLNTSFKVDEGYADETKSLADNESKSPSEDVVMTLPDWVLSHSESDRAGEFFPVRTDMTRIPRFPILLYQYRLLGREECLPQLL